MIFTKHLVTRVCVLIIVVHSHTSAIRVEDTCLPELALQINNTLSKPWGTNDQLIRDIFVYFEELEGIRREVEAGIEDGLDPYKDFPEQMRKFNEVNETGGPVHLQHVIDIRPLIDYYKWNRDNIAEFYELLDFTRDTWKKFNLMFNKKEVEKVLTLEDRLRIRLKEKGVKMNELNTTNDV